jgi:outer membrane protein assembly factor BamA
MPAANVTVDAVFTWQFGITITDPVDQMVSISCVNSNTGRNPQSGISFSAGETLTFTVDDSSYTKEDGNLKWYVNGTVKTGTGSSLVINARDYIKRIYTLTAMILKDGLWYSGQTSFTVID